MYAVHKIIQNKKWKKSGKYRWLANETIVVEGTLSK